MQIRTLHDLFLHELQQVHRSEKTFLNALPKLATKAGKLAVDLATAALSRVQRLEQIFKIIDQVPRAGTCRAMESILAEADCLDGSDTEAQALANAAAVETGRRYLMARYTWLMESANRLGFA